MAIATRLLDLHLLTWNGLVKARIGPGAAKAGVVATQLEGENMRSVCQDPLNPRRLYACSVTDVYVSEDAGDSWQWLPAGGVDYREIWTMSVHPTRANEVYLGTLPAMVYVSENGGRSFRDLSGFRDIPDAARWTFPPAPHAPDIRGIALDARVPDEILIGVEEGGVVRSRDRGQTWEDSSGPPNPGAYPNVNDPAGLIPYEPGRPLEGRVYRDVHMVLRDPSNLERIYAPTGFGVFRTDNGGRSWQRLEYGMDRGYAVPMAVHPEKPNRLFLGAGCFGPTSWKGAKAARTGPFTASRWSPDRLAETGGALSEVLRSDDFGDSWRKLAGGLPSANPYMISGLDINPLDPNMVFATYTDGTLYESDDAGETWRAILSGIDRLFGVRVAIE
ncbi:MAG: WD40/YVTN/BNR-like repeat-containing protein [Chloroflexota bacterium]